MKSRWIKTLGILLITGIFFTCVEPFTPKLNDSIPLLVVDALFTDESISNYVKLSRIKLTLNGGADKVTGATVTIKDDSGASFELSEFPGGLYKSDNPSFRGEPGKSYTLHIRTVDGKEYKSEPATMYEVRNIDSLYFGKDKVTREDGYLQEGVRVYIDSEQPAENKYFRWTYEEWWEFNIPTPKSYVYVNERNIYEIPVTNVTCWKQAPSDEIIIESSATMDNREFIKKPILFIPSDKSNRFLVQYCIQVKQLSISKREYEYWDHLRQINEAGGDIFDKQPFQVNSNIQSLDHPEEPVLGYFQVSAVKRMRKYLTNQEFNKMNLPRYYYDCQLISIGPGDPETDYMAPPVTFNKIYDYFTDLNYIFIQPVYNEYGGLSKLMFVTEVCADCSLTGSVNKPDFWIDMK
jgi:hypothetical protein